MRFPVMTSHGSILVVLYLQGSQMEKTGELAMWDKRPKSNLLLESKIKTLSPKHNLPAGQVVCYTAVFIVVEESQTTLKFGRVADCWSSLSS